MVTWRDTEFPKLRRIDSTQTRREYLDSVDPTSPFVCADAPPFPSHPRFGAVSVNGCTKKKGKDQNCDALEVKRNHDASLGSTRLQASTSIIRVLL